MKEFTLKNREEDWITFHIPDEKGKLKSYKVPVRNSLTLGEVASMQADLEAGARAFFEKYLGADVFNNLRVDQFREMVREWAAASDKAENGPELGES